jgi:CheY-like chemotaxis protein
MNLCTNAFHAMEETGGILSITLKTTTLSPDDLSFEPSIQPGQFMQLSIGDTGSGINPEIQDKIFDPYFTTKAVGKGTGMGLAIIHGIVKNYGGVLSCRSQPGKGSIFDVYLPVLEDAEPPENTPENPLPLGNERILVVDDEEALVKMIKSMLEVLGYKVTTRTNSLEALAIFEAQPQAFDLVITDQTMPAMTGSDLAHRMLQIRPDLPIILCTGYSSLISEEKAMAMGIKGFALKPLAKKDIAALIRKVLRKGESS